MDSIKCEALIVSIDMGSFSAAANRLGYTPSGITRMVNSVEDELGIRIVSRSSSGIKLTDEGEKVISSIREFVRWSKNAMEISSMIKGLDIGSITIGTYYSIASSWLPGIIKSFSEDYPGISINLIEAGNNKLKELLSEGKVDCCFMSKRDFDFEWIDLKQDELMVWLPKDHPKAKMEKFPIKAVSGEAFIMTLPNENNDIEELIEKENLAPIIKYTTLDNYSTYSMVASGLGISINNGLMSESWHDEVLVKKFEPEQYIMLGVAVKSFRRITPALKKFISYVKELV